MFVAHFMGDISQPLHASGVAIGGNAYSVRFNNRTTNLHSVWDSSIIFAAANATSFSNSSIAPYFSALVPRIRGDTFSEPTADWTSCTDPSTPVKCAMAWARDTAQWNCDYVFSQIFNGTGVDLFTSGYASGAYPIVQLQVAKAGLRLATWLNNLVDVNYNPAREVVLQTNPSWLLGTSGGI